MTFQFFTNTYLLNNIKNQYLLCWNLYSTSNILWNTHANIENIIPLQNFNFLLKCKYNDFISPSAITRVLNQTNPTQHLFYIHFNCPRDTLLLLDHLLMNFWIWICHYCPWSERKKHNVWFEIFKMWAVSYSLDRQIQKYFTKF